MTRILSALVVVLFIGQLAACKSDECTTDFDCPEESSCRLGLCSPLVSEGDALQTPENVLDCRPAELEDLLLVEILADPGGVDVNEDGFYDSSDDEFVELVNIASVPVGLLNVQLRVSGSSVDLESACVPAGAAHVHFGAIDRLGLNNSGDRVDLLVDGEIVDTHTYGGEGGSQQSLTRELQLDKQSAWVKHSELAEQPWSPGTCPGGQAFPDCTIAVEPGQDATSGHEGGGSDTSGPVSSACEHPSPSAGDVLINEFFFDPESNDVSSDANLDGTVDAKGDEFVEVVNVSGVPLALDGLRLEEGNGKGFVFPVGTCLEVDQAALVFGKFNMDAVDAYSPALVFGFGDDEGYGLALNNTGDSITLLTSEGLEVDSVVYSVGSSNPHRGRSMVRSPELNGLAQFIAHDEAPGAQERLFSPGTCTTGAMFPTCEASTTPEDGDAGASSSDVEGVEDATTTGPDGEGQGPCGPAPKVEGLLDSKDLVINELLSDPDNVDHNGDGTYKATDDEYIEVVNRTDGPLDVSSVWIVSGGAEFPLYEEGCLPPYSGLVIFGGGETGLSSTEEAIFTQAPALNLPNDGGRVRLEYRAPPAAPVVLDSVDYESLSGVAWARDPDGSGPMVPHNSHSEVVGLQAEAMPDGFSPDYSPGLCADWSPFGACL